MVIVALVMLSALSLWVLAALYLFAPEFFLHVDLSDLLSGLVIMGLLVMLMTSQRKIRQHH